MKAKATKIFHEHKNTFGKYLITGTITVVFNTLILALILVSTDFSKIWSVLLAAALTIIFGFLINTIITFKSKMTLFRFFKYILLAMTDLIIIKFTTVLFLSLGINVFIVSLLNTACVVPLNYICFKYLIFK